MKKHVCTKKRLTVIFALLSVISAVSAKTCEAVAEYVFAGFLFKIFSAPIGFVTGLFSFSFAEAVLCLLPVIIVFVIIKFIGGLWAAGHDIDNTGKKAVVKYISGCLWNCGLFISAAAFAFMVLCGANYYRRSFVSYCDFETGEYSVDELYELCVYLAKEAGKAREKIEGIDKSGIMKLTVSKREAGDEAKKAMDRLAEKYPVISRTTGRVKPVILSKYMSYTGIVGIYIPFTMEANINIDVPDYSLPMSACHELAHLAGFMSEDEANFIAYLACIGSDNPEFVYSGYAGAYIYASNRLYDESREKYKEADKYISQGVNLDYGDEVKYWAKFNETETGRTVSNIADKVNNTYLQINGEKEGTKSYGMVTDLLLAEYFGKHS